MTKAQLQKEIDQLQEQLSCVTRRHDYAITELSELAQGLGNKAFWYDEAKHSWDKAMQNKAAKAVDKIAKMRLL